MAVSDRWCGDGLAGGCTLYGDQAEVECTGFGLCTAPIAGGASALMSKEYSFCSNVVVCDCWGPLGIRSGGGTGFRARLLGAGIACCACRGAEGGGRCLASALGDKPILEWRDP
jgi:hypothetical protein